MTTLDEMFIHAFETSMEYAPHQFSLNPHGAILYLGSRIPDSLLSSVSQGVYHNMLLEIISQAESLKRRILTPEELALSACDAESDVTMTDERALRECQEAQHILNEHIANNFVADVCIESNGCLGFSYDPERYAGIEARTSDAA